MENTEKNISNSDSKKQFDRFFVKEYEVSKEDKIKLINEKYERALNYLKVKIEFHDKK